MAPGTVCMQAPSETVLPPVERLVAIGDLHGDIRKARRAFQLGGLIDEQDRWIGGTTNAVQVGCRQQSRLAGRCCLHAT